MLKGLSKYDNLREAIRNFYYNKVVMNAEITNVFIGDLAFAKEINGSKSVDANKRSKQVQSPIDLLNTELMNKSSFKMAILEDVILDIETRDYFDTFNKFLPKEIVDQYKEGIERTDGQTYITLDRAFDILRGLGQLTPQLKEAYPKLKEGTESPYETSLVMNAFKPFYFGLSKVKNSNGETKIVPTQKKDSELVLLRSFADKNTKLKKILDAVEEQELDGVTFESTIKMGKRNVTNLDNLNNLSFVEFENNNYGIQQPSPFKHVNQEVKVGTQFRKLIISNLEGNYNVSGNTLTSEQVANTFMDIVNANIVESYKSLIDDLGVETNDINKLQEVLLRELDNGNYGEEYYDALDTSEGSFKLALWNPFHSHRIESMLNSIVKKRVTQQKIKGATYINASDYGVSYNNRDLKLKVKETEDGAVIEYMEAILPAWSQPIMRKYMNADGTIKDTMPDELRNIVGYRIPTEDKYSMMNVRIVGFSPQSQGGHIFLPAEITKISGLDFDIDKLFFMIPETDIDLNYIPYNYEVSAEAQSRQARNNGMIEIAKGVLSSPQHFVEQLNPGGFENWKTIRDNLRKITSTGLDMSDFNLPQTQRNLFLSNNSAGALIGIYANHNASHAMLQFQPLELNVDSKVDNRIAINNRVLDTFDKPGVGISRRLGTLVAAAVDAVKDPIFYDLNMNTITADMAATLIRLGATEEETALILNQPIFKDIVEKASRKSFVDLNVIAKIIFDIEAIIPGGAVEGEVTTKMLKDDIKNNNHNPLALGLFKKVYRISQDLNTIVQAARSDSAPAGPTIADNEYKIRRANRVKDNQLRSIANSHTIFDGNYKLIDAFYTYGIEKPTEDILAKHLPWLNKGFQGVKDTIEDYTLRPLTSREINDINYSLMSYIYTGVDFFNISNEEYKDLVDNFPTQLAQFKDKTQDKYLILDMLNVNTRDKTISFKNTTKVSNEKLTELRDSWEVLYENEDTKDIALKLIKYNFSINGFKFNAKSFSRLMPVKFYTDKEVFGNEFVGNAIETSKKDRYIFTPFIEQYIRNNYRRLGIPTISSDSSKINIWNKNKDYIEVFSVKPHNDLSKYDPAINVIGYPKYIQVDDNLYKRIGEIVNNRYMVIPSLGNANLTDYTYGEEFPQPKLQSNEVKVQGKRFGSANVIALADKLGLPTEDVDTITLIQEEKVKDDEVKIQRRASFSINQRAVNTLHKLGEMAKNLETDASVIDDQIFEVYDANPNLKNIAPFEIYLNYIQTVFPESIMDQPLYHGSSVQFHEFDLSKGGSNTNTEDSTSGIFLSSNRNVASLFVDSFKKEDIDKGFLMPVMVNITMDNEGDPNALVYNENVKEFFLGSDRKNNLIREAKKDNMDAIIFNVDSPNDSIFVTDDQARQEFREKLTKVKLADFDGRNKLINALTIGEININPETNQPTNVRKQVRNLNEFIIFDPKNTLIMGSNNDVRGFREYVDNNPFEGRTDEEANERKKDCK